MTERISDLNLPWKLDIRSGCLAVYPAKDGDTHYCLAGGNKWAIHFKEGKRICDEDGKLVTWEMDQMDIARASFMVRACNCHADLLEALKLLLSHPSDNPADAVKTDDGYFLSPLNIAEREARRLIREVEEQS